MRTLRTDDLRKAREVSVLDLHPWRRLDRRRQRRQFTKTSFSSIGSYSKGTEVSYAPAAGTDSLRQKHVPANERYGDALTAARSRLLDLSDDWGELGDIAPSAKAISSAISYVRQLVQQARRYAFLLPTQPPSLLPIPDGGVALAWGTADCQIGLEFEADGSCDGFAALNYTTGSQISGPGEDRHAFLLGLQMVVKSE